MTTPVAPNLALTLVQNSTANNVTPIITNGGAPVVPTSLTVLMQPANGIVSVVGVSLSYTPNVGYHGVDPFTYKATVTGIDSNVATVTPSVFATIPTDLGRVTRGFVSGYTAARTEIRRIRRYSKRQLVANFNGAMEPGRLITQVRWDCTSPWSTAMSNARVLTKQRQAAVDVAFNYAGAAALQCTVTLDNDEVLSQEFHYTVTDAPIYPGAVYDPTNNTYTLTAGA